MRMSNSRVLVGKFLTSKYKIQEFYLPILGPARAYKDDEHERRQIQTIYFYINFKNAMT